jgi:hypothetical protein
LSIVAPYQRRFASRPGHGAARFVPRHINISPALGLAAHEVQPASVARQVGQAPADLVRVASVQPAQPKTHQVAAWAAELVSEGIDGRALIWAKADAGN